MQKSLSREKLPRRFNRYMLLSRMDEGGMTDVYAARLAEEVGPGRRLLIKILPVSSGEDVEHEARFIEEARIVLNLSHGNITAAFEFGREQDRPFLVMEYVPGASLRRVLDYLKTEKLSMGIEEALYVSREVSRALAYAHSYSDTQGSRGLIHRDVSPDNVLVSTSGHVKLTDFGIARMLDSRREEGVWGKAAYIAPELIEGRAASAASDIYSLGAVLYECITLKTPHQGKDDEETLKMARGQNVKPPSTLRPEVGKDLDKFLMRVLSRNPADRPQSAPDFEKEIAALMGKINFSDMEKSLASTVLACTPEKDESAFSKTEEARVAGKTVPIDAVEAAGKEGVRGKSRLMYAAAGILLIVAAVAAGIWMLYSDPVPLEVLEDEGAVHGDTRAPARAPARLKITGNPVKKPEHAQQVKKNTRAGKTGTARARKKSFGWLNINSYPWSYVSIDGERLDGHTPLRRVKTEAGTHTLVFENPELGVKKVKKVNVKAWDEVNVGVRLE